jgi:hypothetical protein
MITSMFNPEHMYVFFYEQVHKTTGEHRHINLGKTLCRKPKNTAKWQTMKLLQERCLSQTPWLVRQIGAMPIDMYERHKFANYDGPVILENYVHPT